MAKIFLFPGQGSQKIGMGTELYDEFSDYIKKSDDILGYSIRDLCIDGPEEKLNNTAFTQPALFVVNTLHYLKKLSDGEKPDFVAGHSLGEYNALFASGVFDFETGLKLVQKRGEIMSKAKNGGMAAVMGLDADVIMQSLSSLGTIDIANYNSPGQIVISGPDEDIDKSESLLKDAGAKLVVKLNVSGAFHSRYMNDAKNEFGEFMETFDFSNPSVPVVSNYNAGLYNRDNVKENLLNQVSSSVRWTESMEYLLSQKDPDFIEVGPGKVLAGLLRKIKKNLNK